MPLEQELKDYTRNNLSDKLIRSRITSACAAGPCIMGIGKMGFYSALGPGVLVGVIYPTSEWAKRPPSKMPEQNRRLVNRSSRMSLFNKYRAEMPKMTYVIRILAPNSISNKLCGSNIRYPRNSRREGPNLFSLIKSSIVEVVSTSQEAGLNLQEIYTNEEHDSQFKQILSCLSGYNVKRVSIEEEATNIVGIARLFSRVVYEYLLKRWKFVESRKLKLQKDNLRSGLIWNEALDRYLREIVDPIFAYPTVIKFNFLNVESLMDELCAKCQWVKHETVNYVEKLERLAKAFEDEFSQLKELQAPNSSCDSRKTRLLQGNQVVHVAEDDERPLYMQMLGLTRATDL